MPRIRALSALLVLLISACSSAPRPMDAMSNCYDGLDWFSWSKFHYQAKVVSVGPAYRDGEDASVVLIPRSGIEAKTIQEGFYLFSDGHALYFPFLTLLQPGKEYVFLIHFKKDDIERKIWIRYAEVDGKVTAYQPFAVWSHDIRAVELVSRDVPQAEAEKILAKEIIDQVGDMRSTYDKQELLFRKLIQDKEAVMPDTPFVSKLKSCALVPDSDIRKAVDAELAKFR